MDPILHLDENVLRLEKSYSTPYQNSSFLPALLVTLALQKHSPQTTEKFDDEYDYIIVGAGAAGSAVANRLSEINCATVLLLEAGPPAPILSELPGIAHQMAGSDLDWKYVTEPLQHTGGAFKDRRVKYPRGRMIGGSTSLNTMQYVRGNHENYNEWERDGATGWGFEKILQYFKKAEDNMDANFLNSGYHGRRGPMTVDRPRYEGEIKQPLIEAISKLGYRVSDPNGKTQTGIYDSQAFYKRGQRCSASKGYLVPVDDRKNLHIVPGAFVRKVAIEKGRAVGVIFDHKSKMRTVRARREVIVSGGTISTPQILMLSGIGPAEDLKKLGIPVIADLPVGKYLQDHCATFQAFLVNKKIDPFDVKITNPSNINNYISYKKGPLASTLGRAMEIFVNDNIPNKLPDFPPLEIYFTEASSAIMKREYNLKDEVYRAVFKPYEKKAFYICQVQPVQPKSRGYIKLRTTNPYDHPIINPNYLAVPEDFEQLVQGMKICHEIGTSEAMKKIGSVPINTTYPGCEAVTGNLDSYLRCVGRLTCSAFHHQVGTARMGAANDPETVLDPELRVKNIRGLRVVDASVMPRITSGNTEAPTIMIAEKGAAMIRHSHGQCPITKSNLFKHHKHGH